MDNKAESQTQEFSKRATPDLRTQYSAEMVETVPYITLWEGEANEAQFDFRLNEKPFRTVDAIENFRRELINFQTKGKNYTDNPKSRLVSLDQQDKLIMTFQRVNYSDFIVTNNSMEVVLPTTGKTIRESLEPGPELSPLSESLCSNHLGISCLVVTSDNKLILNVGSSTKITGASKISSSASGSMDYKEPFTTPFEVMQAELYEELGIVPSEETSDMRAIAIARELQRGGKPEMFFVMFTEFSSDHILSLVRSDPDKEVESVYAVDLPMDKNQKVAKISELATSPNNAESTKAALYYLARNLDR